MDIFQKRLTDLRQIIKIHQAHGFLVPRVDCFQGEYVAAHDERLAWLTNFMGSAGFAIILNDKAALFVDSHYTLQAQKQVDLGNYEIILWTFQNIKQWLKDNCVMPQVILYDSWLHTVTQIEDLNKIIKVLPIRIKGISMNPIDQLWQDRPLKPSAKIYPHSIQWSGEESSSKIKKIINILNKVNSDAVIISQPESIAWLLNIRGEDVPYTPVPHAFAIVYKDSTVNIFIDLSKVNDDVRQFCGVNTHWYEFDHFIESLTDFSGKNILIDPKKLPQKICDVLIDKQVHLVKGTEPCEFLKALKNSIEIQGAYNAHKRDAVAVINFLAWLEEKVIKKDFPTEIEAADYLLKQRQQQDNFKSLSFTTISAMGANGAIVHYQPNTESNAILYENGLYLIDSGGQYLDGTTDITRTIAIGTPSQEHKDHYTHVLKGHIALASVKFPAGTTGSQLDVLARQYLWKAGLDYGHGTGHGVGSYLSVHEGPQRISKVYNSVPLQDGMIVSNEPGYYKAEEYGIRIENLILVKNSPHYQDGSWLEFDTLTLVPFDKNLINIEQLTPSEIDWINTYHNKIWNTLSPLTNSKLFFWLKKVTKSI